MAEITFKGTPMKTNGELPREGAKAPGFQLVRRDLSEVTLEDFAGRSKLLNVFPSLDTSVCARSIRAFHEKASARSNLTVLHVSRDLPFAAKRFAAAEGLDDVETLSAFRSRFPADYGLEIVEGPMKGLCARAVLVLDADDRVIHRQLVPEIAEEPDYDAALAALG